MSRPPEKFGYCNCSVCKDKKCVCGQYCGCMSNGDEKACPCHKGNYAGAVLTPDNVLQLSKTIEGKTEPTNDVNVLEESLLELAKELFSKAYNYPYHGDDTVPSDINSGASVKSISDFVHVNIGNVDRATTTFRRVLAGRGIPEWAIEKVVPDIGDKAASMFLDTVPGQWKETLFGGSYKGPKPSDTVDVRGAIVYTSATLTEDGETGPHMVLAYVAIYYGPKESIQL